MGKKKQQRDSHQELPDNRSLAVNASPTGHLSARLFTIILALAAILLFAVTYLARMDRVIGMFQDDAWYVLLGKALATGQGYTLINSPTGGILPLYPPAFPFLISLVFRILPQFPENLWLIKSLSVAAMFLTGLACYRFFTRYRSMPGISLIGVIEQCGACPWIGVYRHLLGHVGMHLRPVANACLDRG